VNQYAFELEEIFNMIGGYSKWEKLSSCGMASGVPFKLLYGMIG